MSRYRKPTQRISKDPATTRIFAAFVTILIFAIVIMGGFIATLVMTQASTDEDKLNDVDITFDEAIKDPSAYQEDFVFNYSSDMQLPELPTGCEATAASTLLRMNGVDVSKTEFADKMPKGDGSDFVHEFWGDPYSESGWAIMAPGIVDTIKMFIPLELTVVDLTGTPLTYLPTPCEVWVTIDLDKGTKSTYTQDGYTLLYQSHAVVLTYVDDAVVRCYDPLNGPSEYPFSKFDRAYLANGKQAVYICDRGYWPETEGSDPRT